MTEKVNKERVTAKGRKSKKPVTSEEKKAKREAHRIEQQEKKMKRQRSWGWRSARFIFHLLWLPILLLGGLAGGLVIGYTLFGGEPAADVFTRDLWQHLYDLVFAEG